MVAQPQLPDLMMPDCKLLWEKAGIKNPLKIKFQENSTGGESIFLLLCFSLLFFVNQILQPVIIAFIWVKHSSLNNFYSMSCSVVIPDIQNWSSGTDTQDYFGTRKIKNFLHTFPPSPLIVRVLRSHPCAAAANRGAFP